MLDLVFKNYTSQKSPGEMFFREIFNRRGIFGETEKFLNQNTGFGKRREKGGEFAQIVAGNLKGKLGRVIAGGKRLETSQYFFQAQGLFNSQIKPHFHLGFSLIGM